MSSPFIFLFFQSEDHIRHTLVISFFFFFFSSRRRHTRLVSDWSSDVCSSDLRSNSLRKIRWTQWIFLKLFERGLAYVADVPVNWCPALGTVLANEEIVDEIGRASCRERV